MLGRVLVAASALPLAAGGGLKHAHTLSVNYTNGVPKGALYEPNFNASEYRYHGQQALGEDFEGFPEFCNGINLAGFDSTQPWNERGERAALRSRRTSPRCAELAFRLAWRWQRTHLRRPRCPPHQRRACRL